MPEPDDSSAQRHERAAENRPRPTGNGSTHSYRAPGWQRLLGSFRAAFAGMRRALLTQPNVRIHVGIAVAVALVCWIVKVSLLEAGVLAVCMGMVLAAEVFNTAVEELVDFVSPGYDTRARDIKDLSAAAVLITAGTALVVGLLILAPRAWSWVAEHALR